MMFRQLTRLMVPRTVLIRPSVLCSMNRGYHATSGVINDSISFIPWIPWKKPTSLLQAVGAASVQEDGMFTDSVLRKRRKKMKKHKLRKRRKRERADKRKLSQGK
ncbi:hypothetical protein KAFR_0L01475 [Kazachstania africana CBS 2517]|uniref:Small ribosomal subunit protein mS38 n=1 Tax=Kazachstania africana (strain ATCC 22294 / BCRC 22015 / CBS 2517 / CECT 1963 / NBRC 1671 / NRRL Y-8276) TaxID=1071382 RepID=H2B2A7_KAZAF|nr:hypothetical protein KAFR_0L01475 [Kazachstania africana CBS 2517]CCF60757.1 hypothetical protein KAFR_0L01475 [Kazachstania africana CBS 2517]